MTITGTGFNPGDDINITGGSTFVSATADASGGFAVPANAPELSTTGPGTLTTTLKATDVVAATGNNHGHDGGAVANLAVAIKPLSIPLKQIKQRKITFSFSGFTPGSTSTGSTCARRSWPRPGSAGPGGPAGR